MRCAVIDIATNVVMNVIVADAAVDVAPEGYLFVNVESCGPGWVYDPVTHTFTNPNPPLPEEEEETG